MPPKKECYTKPKKDGGTYTTCVEGQAKPKTKRLVKKYPKKEEEPVKTKRLVKKYPKKVAPLKASGSARRVKAKDTDAGKVKAFLGKAETKTVVARVRNTKQEKPPAPKKAKAPKKQAVQSSTGLTKAEMNKMSPLELFGMLPSLAKKVVLDPKTTGVKVGANVHKFLRQIDNVVDMLVGFEFEYNTAHYLGSGLCEIEPEKIAKVVYGNYLKKVQILSQAVSKEENKFFSGDLLKELERLDRAGKLKGYSYLEGIDKHDINELIHMHVEDREDYSFTDNWALMTPDEAEEDYGNYWMSKRSKSAVKNELEGVTRLKKRIIEDLKKLKGDIQID